MAQVILFWHSLPGYQAPELGDYRYDITSDIYSLCMTFYVLRHHHFYHEQDHLDHLDRILQKGMNTDIEKRYASMASLKSKLIRHKVLPEKKLILSICMLLCFISAAGMRYVYYSEKQAWLTMLEKAERYELLLPYRYDDMAIYQAYFQQQRQLYGISGVQQAIQHIMELSKLYDFSLSRNIIWLMFCESIECEDITFCKWVIEELPLDNLEQNQQIIFDAVIKLCQEPIDQAIELEGEENNIILSLYHFNIKEYQQGYDQAIQLCEKMMKEENDWEEKQLLRKQKECWEAEMLMLEIKQQTAEEGQVLTMISLWDEEDVNQRRQRALVYTALYEQYSIEEKRNHEKLLDLAIEDYEWLLKQSLSDETIVVAYQQLLYQKEHGRLL